MTRWPRRGGAAAQAAVLAARLHAAASSSPCSPAQFRRDDYRGVVALGPVARAERARGIGRAHHATCPRGAPLLAAPKRGHLPRPAADRARGLRPHRRRAAVGGRRRAGPRPAREAKPSACAGMARGTGAGLAEADGVVTRHRTRSWAPSPASDRATTRPTSPHGRQAGGWSRSTRSCRSGIRRGAPTGLSRGIGIRQVAIALNPRNAGDRWPAAPYRRAMRLDFPDRTYRQRWHAEGAFSQHKRRLGSALTARGGGAQEGELVLRVLTHNLALLATPT